MVRPKPKPKQGGSTSKNYSKGNKNMTARQQYKLSKQANRYSYKENTANIRAGVTKTTARAGAGTVGMTSAADSAKDMANQEPQYKPTKQQQDENVGIFDSAAQGFLPTSSDPGQVKDTEQLEGKKGEITTGGLYSSL